MAMTAGEWKDRINAIMRAKANGDDEPLGILCEHLAAMSDLCDPKSPIEIISDETGPKQDEKPIVDESGGLFDEPADDADEQNSEG